MKAVVVYETLWGNTASVAKAIAEGLGSGTKALNTTEAEKIKTADYDLIVAGAPVLAFNLPTETIRESIKANPGKAPKPADFSNPSLRSWLDKLPKGNGKCAAFETRIWWSPGGSIPGIFRRLRRAGHSPLGKGKKFIIQGSYGPMREGELEKAKEWGAELASKIQ